MSIITSTAIFVTSLGIAAAAPALAEDPKPAGAPARPAASVPYQASDSTRVCIRDTITGSRVPRKVCNTMKDWKAKGIDPFQR
jgi:hypothetical protein